MRTSVLVSFCILVSSQLFVVSSHADQSELLIKKFKKVKMQLAPNDPSMPLITLRLADLLSDKARKLTMTEVNQGCVSNCFAGSKERKEALGYYQEAIEKLPSSKKGKILVQMGHLYQLNSQDDKAKKLYLDTMKKFPDTELAYEATFSLAEMFFKDRNFAKAAPLYEKVKNSKFKKRKGLAYYKHSWCQFNNGQVKLGIAGLSKILITPELLTRNGGADVISVDNEFKEEVSRDLATFYTKSAATIEDAQQIYKLSPPSTRQSNIDYFASELERIGKKKLASQVWQLVMNSETNPKKRLEHHIRLAQLEREQGQMKESLGHFSRSLALWSQVEGCAGDDSCKELKVRLRKYILDWNRDEKKSSAQLVGAYKEYISVFPKEVDMLLWGAQAAQKVKDWPQTEQFYIAAHEAQTVPPSGKDIPVKEKILLLYVELSEMSSDEAMKVRAYNYYLSKSTEKSKIVDVKYQQAHRLYENKKYEQASVALKAVALLPGSSSIKVKQQAADLALDALVILKKDKDIEVWSSEFASRFKDKSSEYLEISKKSILNQSAKISQNLDDPEATDKAWAALSRISLAGASESVKLNYYKNKMLLAEKLKRYDDMGLAANELLGFKASTETDRQLALGKKAWLAELRLDFKSALEANQKLKLSSLTPSQKALKLAMLTELSGAKKNIYLDQFLKKTKNKEKARAVALMKVESSSNKLQALKKYKKILSQQPELYTSLYYNLAIESENPKVGTHLLKNKSFANTAGGKSIWRIGFLTKFDSLKEQLTSHQITTANQKTLNKSLKKRISYLNQLEKAVGRAAQKEDWLSQVVSVRLLADQSDRFYKELISLPIPEGLSSQEQQQYLQLLSQQASPYSIKAKELNSTYEKFWVDPNLVQAFEGQFKNCSVLVCKRYEKELNYITEIAPIVIKSKIEMIIAGYKNQPKVSVPSLQTLEAARESVRKDPMNVSYLNQLLSVEKQAGNQSMVSYLKERIDKIKNSKEVF